MQTAIELEELGRDLYDSLAAISVDPRLIRLCRGLAAAERQHERTFRELREDLAAKERTVLVSDADLAEARRALKQAVVPDRTGMIGAVDASAEIDLLKQAAAMERNSISYFRNLSINATEGDLLLRILEEELGHLRLIEELVSQMESEAPIVS